MFEAANILEGLNDSQRQAATHGPGPLLVLAGAGTGKTRTLVARAAWLRAQGAAASRILLLTFTRRAADDMLARVAPRGGGADERICGGTFHAVAHQIIRAHAESFSLPPEFSVIDQADVADLLDVLRADHDLVGGQRRAPRAAVCADIYTRCVNTHTPVTEV
ncbi:MAG TPA: ATP-dependent helicase, partial [Streptosporangiaceae bacterium]|nr:ATP-dependent helicase [Streptosporangiaceae bacterium]